MDPDRLDFLSQPENFMELLELVLYHVLPGETLTTNFSAGPFDTLLPNFQVQVSVDPLLFDDSSVVDPDLLASNGVFNVVGKVLDPFVSSKC